MRMSLAVGTARPDVFDHGINKRCEHRRCILLLHPRRRFAQFIVRGGEIQEIRHVLASRSVVCSCIELEADLVEATGKVHREAPEYMNRRSFAEASRQSLLELVRWPWIEPVRG